MPRKTTSPLRRVRCFYLTSPFIEPALILSVTENGYGKRTAADEYRLTNRAGKA
jgi:hypothetical protein